MLKKKAQKQSLRSGELFLGWVISNYRLDEPEDLLPPELEDPEEREDPPPLDIDEPEDLLPLPKLELDGGVLRVVLGLVTDEGVFLLVPRVVSCCLGAVRSLAVPCSRREVPVRWVVVPRLVPTRSVPRSREVPTALPREVPVRAVPVRTVDEVPPLRMVPLREPDTIRPLASRVTPVVLVRRLSLTRLLKRSLESVRTEDPVGRMA